MMRSLQIAALGLTTSVVMAFGDQTVSTDTVSTGVRFSRDGRSLAVLGENRQVRVWDLAAARFTLTVEPRPEEVFVFLPASGNPCATIATNGTCRVHDMEGGNVIASGKLPVSTKFGGAMASTADGELFAVAGGDPKTTSGNLIQVLDRSGKPRFEVSAGLGGVSSMAFSQDGGTLAAVGYDADVRVWDARTGAPRHVIEGLKVAMFDTAFSPDGKFLATAGADRTVYLWDTQSWKLARKITGQPETISVVRFSPDGRTLVTGGLNERNFNAPTQVILWNLASGRKIQSWTAEHAVWSLSYSPDGEQIAVADGTKSVKLLAVANKRSTAKR